MVAPAQSPREVNRTVRLGGWGLVSGAERTVITPNENAADTLDVKPRTLEDLAHEVLGEGRVANPILVWRLMQEAVANTPMAWLAPCSPPYASFSGPRLKPAFLPARRGRVGRGVSGIVMIGKVYQGRYQVSRFSVRGRLMVPAVRGRRQR